MKALWFTRLGHPDPGAGGLVIRPELLSRLGGPARVSVVSASAGSGKTVLLRSWIAQAGLGADVGWVAAGGDDRDPRRFWLSVVNALRRTAAGSTLVPEVTAAPDLDGWALAERLLGHLAALRDPVWLVIDDVHELGPEVMRQLGMLVLRAPPALRFVLAARHEVRLGLHRLRLEGGLAEIRSADLRFTAGEAGALFAAAGVSISSSAAALLHERTEGWAAGLRLAALSMAGHPDPERFAEEFSGSDRSVAEYLLREVLERQPEPVRRLLLRTSVLERVNGKLADLLTGDDDGELVLQDLEEANAFVVSLDGARSWFRYHPMFAGLLARELRRAEPGRVTGLHRAASQWFAAHGYPVEAIRHAQAAQDRDPAARLLMLARRTWLHRPDLAIKPEAAHADHIAETNIHLNEKHGRIESAQAHARLTGPLSESELRVLRYLPTNLTAPQIARKLFVSPNTVRTHIRHLYAKLGAHRRSEAVERARDLGLIAPSAEDPGLSWSG